MSNIFSSHPSKELHMPNLAFEKVEDPQLRDSLKSTLGWLWILAFLLLPACGIDAVATGERNADTGARPHSSVVFCDIEKKSAPRRCATSLDRMVGIPLAEAALALSGQSSGIAQSSSIGLDSSPSARAALGCGGQPVAITFQGPFPEGTPLCLNCGNVIGPVYADANAACVALCKDLNGTGIVSTTPLDVRDFCELTLPGSFTPEHAHVSTNFFGCSEDGFGDACTEAGALRAEFQDPRRGPEPVDWILLFGVERRGTQLNTLARTAATTGQFDAGASSSQLITRGDGFVEFTATETDKARVCGLSSADRLETGPGIDDISFGVRLSAFGNVLISENGTLLESAPGVPSFGPYATGDRLRVSVKDRFDGTADVTYRLIPAVCAMADCEGALLRRAGPAPYPFRVDASLNQQLATLTEVHIVRIQ